MTTKSIESEQGILGALLIDESKIVEVTSSLQPDDFSQDANKLIYQAMLNVHDKGQSIDFITVLEETKEPSLRDYMISINKQAIVIKNLSSYIKRVLQTSTSRKLMHAASEMIKLAQSEEPKLALELSQGLLMELGGNDSDRDPKHVKEVLKGYVSDLEERAEHKGEMIGLATGFNLIDERIQGIKETDLMIVAGRPGSGKTTYALNIVENAIYRLKKPALIFSMEMSYNQLMDKTISSLGGIHLNELKTAKVIQNDNAGKLVHVISKLNESDLYIDDSAGLTIAELTAKAHSISRKTGGLSAIMVDYIGLMEDPAAGYNLNVKMTKITAGLKALAKTLKCPVIALSQLNRSGGGGDGEVPKKPKMTELRDSGSIEQDADIIQFIHRDEYYTKEASNFKGLAEIITEKFRMGEPGTDVLGFEGHKSRFTNLDYIPNMTPPQQSQKPARRGMQC